MAIESGEFEQIVEHLRSYGDKGKEAVGTTHQLSDAFSSLFRIIGFGYGGSQLSSFLNQLGLVNKEGARLGPIFFENSQQLHKFTAGLGVAVGGAMEFLRAMDAVERKQAELNRAIGIGTVSITQYYHELVTATGMGGKAAREAAEMTMKALTEQRMWTQKEVDAMLPLFVKYSLGISKTFPQDFVFMHEQLGLQLHEISDSYETMGLNAAAASIPFELYKNVVFSLTEQIHKYGFSIQDAMAVTNLFTDDLKKGTMTANEAANVMQTLSQAQMTGGGFGFRVKMAMFLGKAWGEVPPDIKDAIETTTKQMYGEKARFRSFDVGMQARILQEIPPEIFERAWPYAAKETVKMMPEVARPMAFSGMWGIEYMEAIKKIFPALEKQGTVFTKSIENVKNPTEELTTAINALKTTMENSTKGMREWYYPLSQLSDFLRSKGMGEIPAAGGALMGALPGALMTAFAMRGMGVGGGGGGGTSYWTSSTAETMGETNRGLRGFANNLFIGGNITATSLGKMAATTLLLTADMWALDNIVKGLSALFELFKAKNEEKARMEGMLKTPTGLASSIYGLEAALQYKKLGKTDLMKKALEDEGENLFDKYGIFLTKGKLEKIISERKEQYRKLGGTAQPLETIEKQAMIDIEKRTGEIIISFKPFTVSLGDRPEVKDLMIWPK